MQIVTVVPSIVPSAAPQDHLADWTEPGASRIAPAVVVIPCYRVGHRVLDVIAGVGDVVDRIYVVDDACPERTGDLVARECRDPRVRVVRHGRNQGVGGATITGIRAALADDSDVIVKLDGDGQMDPAMLPVLIALVRSGQADYAKGNRFFDPDAVAAMPPVRLVGNAGLSFLTKISTGYWKSFDPTNGYFAIHGDVARLLPLDRIARRYFFESDLLFRLSTFRAKVVDVPMPAVYGDETSGLAPARMVIPFALGHLRNFCKRIAYNYFLRDFSLASVQLLAGLTLLLFGSAFGLAHWGASPTVASSGTVMLAGVTVILGVQFLLAFLAHDIQSAPEAALHPRLTAWSSSLRSRPRSPPEEPTCAPNRTSRSTTDASPTPTTR
ncbi:glycosyltransferase family 2 protein [Rhodoplanes sp. SY1]|uniref:glycosyltransferase family 2 protein n=1 Tax=Rhodoplanes sp. SY1 TaxID=3166646 RepID=UPI0038B5BB8B